MNDVIRFIVSNPLGLFTFLCVGGFILACIGDFIEYIYYYFKKK